MSSRRRPWIRYALQGLASVAVIAALLADAELDAVKAALANASIGWVALATAVKAASVVLHELRLWIAMKVWREPPLGVVVEIGFVSGLLNMILPIRGGDLIAVLLLKRELDVPAPEGAAAVGITGFLEAALFALFLLAVLLFGAASWEEMLGVATTRTATGTLSLITVGAVLGAAGLVVVARRIRRGEERSGPGPIQLVRSILIRTGDGLASRQSMAWNLALAVVQVAAVVAAFWCILPALGLEVPLSLLAVCGVIAVGSLTAIVLPPSFGAGPAAASVLVLGFFGVPEAEAMAYFALNWVVNTAPPVLLGLLPLVKRVGHLSELMGELRASTPDA